MQKDCKKIPIIAVKLFIVVSFIAFFALNVTSAEAATYYVKNGGNDSADGLSDATAWATVAKVNSFAVSPGFSSGDIIQFKRGSTWSNDERLGANSDYIIWGTINGLTIQDYGTGALPFLNGNTQQPIRMDATGISNLVIKNLDISGMDWVGNTWDFNMQVFNGTNVTVEGIYCDGRQGSTENRVHSGAIVINQSLGNTEIKNCELKNFYPTTMPQTLYATHSWSSYDCNGILIWYEPAADTPKLSGTISIHDNVISNFWADGISISGVQSPDGTNIYNNTISNYGEQAIDLKKSAYVNIYLNDLSHNDFGLSPGGGYEAGTTIIAGSDSDSWPSYWTHDINIYDNYLHDSKMKSVTIQGSYANIYRNLFKNTGNCIMLDSSHATIYDNIFNLNASLYSGYVGVEKSAIGTGEHRSSVDYALIYNNTFYISHGDYLYGIAWQGVTGQASNVIKNNAIQMTANSASVYPLYLQDYDSSNNYPTVDNNLFYNANHTNRVLWDETAYTSAWNNSLFTAPGFSDAASGEFWSASEASAIVDAGVSSTGQAWDSGLKSTSTWTPAISVETILGTENGGRDMGAYEFQSGSDTTPPSVPQGLAVE